MPRLPKWVCSRRAQYASTNPPGPEEIEKLAKMMPKLAGKPLPCPRFHATDWHFGQKFRAADDPDRTQEAWEPPAFAIKRDPREQAAQTVCEELEIEPSERPSDESFARVVRHVVDEECCAALIASVNAKGFTPALLNLGGGTQQLMPNLRDGHRVIVDSKELSSWLLEVVREHLPQRLGERVRIVGLNERLRFLCYTPGQFFEEHHDATYIRPRTQPRGGDFSYITVQLYLHDVPQKFGGATTFFPSSRNQMGFQPEAGSVLLFTQDLTHEGSLVKDGLKYTLRTEVMYTKRSESPPPELWPAVVGDYCRKLGQRPPCAIASWEAEDGDEDTASGTPQGLGQEEQAPAPLDVPL